MADTRWVSYAEIAQARGTDIASAMRLVRRKKWPKRTANEGGVRVAVPADVLRDKSERPSPVLRTVPETVREDVLETVRPDESRIIKVLEDQIAILRDQLAAGETREADFRRERDRLLGLMEQMAERAGEGKSVNGVDTLRAEAAERQVAALQALIDDELAQLRAMTVQIAQAREQKATADSRPAPESHRAARPRRRGWLGMLFGR